MPKIDCIDRDPELVRALVGDMKNRGLTRAKVAELADVNIHTVYRMLHPRSRGGVSKASGLKIIEVLTPDPVERIRRVISTGIPVYRMNDGSDRFFYLL